MKLRDYRQDDFAACVAIVNKVWDFDGHLEPPALADFVKQLYVGGSVAESRYSRVVEADRQVCGLLFGKCGPGAEFPNEYHGIRGRVRTAYRFLKIRGLPLRRKLRWLRANGAHEIARSKVEPRSDGEINLLAVDPASQGVGFGKKLLADYVAHCRSAGVERLTVETDVHSNYGFYEYAGFSLVGKFNSQMNELFTGGSGDSFVYELRL